MKSDKDKEHIDELGGLFCGVPPKNILISFGDKPARPLDELAKEQKNKQGRRKKHDEPER